MLCLDWTLNLPNHSAQAQNVMNVSSIHIILGHILLSESTDIMQFFILTHSTRIYWAQPIVNPWPIEYFLCVKIKNKYSLVIFFVNKYKYLLFKDLGKCVCNTWGVCSQVVSFKIFNDKKTHYLISTYDVTTQKRQLGA